MRLGAARLIERLSVAVTALLACTCAGFASQALADYPERPIRYIVPSAPGGGADISARLLTAELAAQLNQQFVIDNRPSSGGLIGIQLLMQARPDGYTLGYGNMVYLAINPSLVPNLGYDPARDLTPIGQFTSNQNVLAVRLGLPVKSVADLIAYARANPDKLSFASSGNGTTLHLSGELFKQMTGTRMVHVPYKAVAQALNDMMAGQIDVIFDNQSSIAPFVTSGRVRALAVTGPTRSTALPDLPTMNEAGVKGYVITTWAAMIGPKGLPKAIVTKLNAEMQRACLVPKVQAALAAQGATCAGGSPEQFAQFVNAERVKWGDIVRRSGAKID
jgi:tripartite-type tricarboxylate transporter receptor subunit TctC